MLLFVVIISFAMLRPAISNPISEDPVNADFLPENSLAFNGLDAASPLPIDFSTQPLDFLNSEPLSPETDLFTDSSENTPPGYDLFADSLGPLLESSCVTNNNDSPLYVKRDGSTCAPRTDESLPLQLKLPDLDEIEAQLDDFPRFKKSTAPSFDISPIPAFSQNDDLCPVPKRRLCCAGPISNLIPGFDLYVLVNHCRGM